ncbi:hypothetical protein BGZ63DRAFT_494864 [Mariannaea sp. PMI_226]|nr:hypothetical protein BGZ63DRAFT_494864 [Mariannaea sp. PMI_226]
MFELERQRILESSLWEPRNGCLGYLEACSCVDIEGNTLSPHCRSGYLQDAEVDDWSSQKGQFASRTPASIRVLMCERVGWVPLGFAMSKRSFLSVEGAFGLPPEALPILNLNRGQEYYNATFNSGDNSQSMSSIALTIKLPQLFQLGNLGLSLTHCFQTGKTLAFIHGWHVFANENHVTGEPVIPHAGRIQELIQPTHSLWTHPLLLPVILLQEHLFRAYLRNSELWRIVQSIEKNLGVTRSGPLVMAEFGVTNEMKQIIAKEEDRIRLTAILNTAAADISGVIRVLKWDQQYTRFPHRVKDRIDKYHGQGPLSVCSELASAIEFLDSHVSSAEDFAGSMRSRLDLQLNVLYNLIAHASADLNLRIASMAGLDSAAMKTLTFVTIAFLPATFIAVSSFSA